MPECGDCDDTNSAIYPGAEEICDGFDNDCDAATVPDGGDDDTDLDGFLGCAECDDYDDAVHPGADELCNGEDDDCDGSTDEDATDAITPYADTDGDGYGDAETVGLGCEATDGWSASSEDCDDGDAFVYPDAAEAPCDGVDQDCSSADYCNPCAVATSVSVPSSGPVTTDGVLDNTDYVLADGPRYMDILTITTPTYSYVTLTLTSPEFGVYVYKYDSSCALESEADAMAGATVDDSLVTAWSALTKTYVITSTDPGVTGDYTFTVSRDY